MDRRGSLRTILLHAAAALREASHAPPLAVLVLLVLVAAPLEDWIFGARAVDLLVCAGAVLAVYASGSRRRMLDVALAFAAFSLAAGWLGQVITNPALAATRLGLDVALLSLAAWLATREVYRARLVTMNTVLAAGTAYGLVAVLWARAFFALGAWQPGALIVRDPAIAAVIREPGSFSTMLSHSLMNLATLGDDALVPATAAARTLAATEALVGLVLVVALVARLATTHTLSKAQPTQKQPQPSRHPVILKLIRGEKDTDEGSGGN